MSTITIAPHLQRALETMSKDMAVDPQALVNQAVFAWLRINGYVTPGAPVAQSVPVVVAPRIEPVVELEAPVPPPVVVAREPEPEPIPEPQPEPEPEAAAPTPPEPAPVVAAPLPPVVEEKPVAPAVDPRIRMSAIEADLARLTKPWAAWHGEESAEDEEEPAAAPDEDARDDAERAIDEAHRALAAEDGAIDTDRHASGAVEEPTGTAGQSLVEEEPLDGHTGETEVEPPPESTVVLKSNPITLYLERDGEEPIRVGTDRFIIGRGPQCDLIIDSPRVSREHAALTRAGVTYILEDLNSSNGTWYGEERVTRRELESGDTISLGNEPITFVLRAE